MSLMNESSDFNLLSPRSKAKKQVRVGRNIEQKSNSAARINKSRSKSPKFNRMPVMLEGNEELFTPLPPTNRKIVQQIPSMPPIWAPSSNDDDDKEEESEIAPDDDNTSSPFQLDNVADHSSAKMPQRFPSPPPMSSDNDGNSTDTNTSMPLNDEVEYSEHEPTPASPHSIISKSSSVEVVEMGVPQVSQRGSLGRIRSFENRQRKTVKTTETVEMGAPQMSQRGSLGRIRSFEAAEKVEIGVPYSQRGSLGRARSFEETPMPVVTPNKTAPPPPPPRDDDLTMNDLAAISSFSTEFTRRSVSGINPEEDYARLQSVSDDGSYSAADPELGHSSNHSSRPKAHRVPRQKVRQRDRVQRSPELDEKDPTKFEELPFWLTVLFLTILGIIFGFVAVKVS